MGANHALNKSDADLVAGSRRERAGLERLAVLVPTPAIAATQLLNTGVVLVEMKDGMSTAAAARRTRPAPNGSASSAKLP